MTFKQKKVPIILLFVPLLIDIFNGMMKGAAGGQESVIGVGFRGLILLYSLYYFKRYKYSLFILFLVLFSCFVFIFHFSIGGFSFASLTHFFKVLFGYTVLVILLSNKQCENEVVVCNCAISYAVGAAISLVICGVLGIGYSSYIDGTFGTKGFFIAMNDVGLTMIMMNTLSLYMYQKTGERLYMFLSLIIALGCAFVGSMAAYFGTALAFLAYVFNIFFIRFSDSKSSKKQRFISIVLLTCILVLAANTLLKIISEDAYLSVKYGDIASNIFEVSGRSSLIDAANAYMNSQPISYWLFGSGDQFLYAVGRLGGYGNVMKGVESDIIDFIGTYGIFLTIMLLYLPVKYLCISIHRFIKSRELIYYWMTVISLMFWGHAFYGGHAFSSPLSMTFYMITFYLIDRKYTRPKEVLYKVLMGLALVKYSIQNRNRK